MTLSTVERNAKIDSEVLYAAEQYARVLTDYYSAPVKGCFITLELSDPAKLLVQIAVRDAVYAQYKMLQSLNADKPSWNDRMFSFNFALGGHQITEQEYYDRYIRKRRDPSQIYPTGYRRTTLPYRYFAELVTPNLIPISSAGDFIKPGKVTFSTLLQS